MEGGSGWHIRRHCMGKGWAVPGLPVPIWTTFMYFTHWASSDASMWSKSPTVLKGRNKKHWKSLHPIKLAISQFCLRLAFSRKVNQLLTKDLVYTERCWGVGVGRSLKCPALINPKLQKEFTLCQLYSLIWLLLPISRYSRQAGGWK